VLEHRDPEAVLNELRRLPTARARDPAAAATVRDATLGYLERRGDQIRYPEFRALRYPIGSGSVESANKLVVEVRLRGSGMRWAPEHVNPTLGLRTIVCNHHWEEAWPQVCRRSRRPSPSHHPPLLPAQDSDGHPEIIPTCLLALECSCPVAGTSGRRSRRPGESRTDARRREDPCAC
jgi:hypothetical protein